METQTIVTIIAGAIILLWLGFNISFIMMFSLNKRRIRGIKEVLELNAKNLSMNNQDIMEMKASIMQIPKIIKLLDSSIEEESMDTQEKIAYKKKQAKKLWNEAKKLEDSLME